MYVCLLVAHHFYKRGTHTICYIPTPYCSSQELVGSPSLWLYSMSICDVRAEEKSRRRSRIYIEAHFQMHWEKRYGKHFFLSILLLPQQHVKASFLNQLFVYGCKQVNVYISDIHWSSNRPKAYLFHVVVSNTSTSKAKTFLMPWSRCRITFAKETNMTKKKEEKEKKPFFFLLKEFFFQFNVLWILLLAKLLLQQTNAFAGCCCCFWESNYTTSKGILP